MNYYEQFYDDLEFEPQDSYHDDPYYHDDYYRDRHYRNQYEREYGEPRYHTYEEELTHPLSFRGPRYPDRGRGHYDRGRGGDYGSRGRGGYSGRGDQRGRGGGFERGRGSERGRGRGGNKGDQRNNNKSTPAYNQENKQEGKNASAQQPKKLMYGNFVKATNPETDSKSEEKKTEQAVSKSSDTTRFDYKKFQNQRSETEKEVEQALKAYSVQLGFGYGYGPRTDLGDSAAEANWIDQDGQTAGELELSSVGMSSNPSASTSAPSVATKTAATPPVTPKPAEMALKLVKKAVRPEYNFVKANSEFHSIDVAFHEAEMAPKPNHLSVNMGNKKIGLGFGTSMPTVEMNEVLTERFHKGLKDGSNQAFDGQFAKLHEAVKAKNLPNKNGIEILHMAVDRTKMALSDEIKQYGRTQTGQIKFLCRLYIDGVFVGQGHCTQKKAAKHEAYANAVQLLLKDNLTVKEVSKNVLELKEKQPEFKIPMVPEAKPGTTTGTSGAPQQPLPTKQKTLTALSKQEKEKPARPPTQINLPTPRIVFHKATLPNADKPLEFKTPTTGPSVNVSLNFAQSGKNDNQYSQSCNSSPADLAQKLLNSVKESSSQGVSVGMNNQGSPRNDSNSGQNPRNANNSVHSPLGKRPAPLNWQQGVKLQAKKGRNKPIELADLSQFIIVDTCTIGSAISQSELTILYNSANFNKVALVADYENVDQGVKCSLSMCDEIVGSAAGENKQAARVSAAQSALEELRDVCYTLKVKQDVDNSGAGLSKEQLMSDIQKSSEMLPDSNVGNMLLKKMGWTGGGVGKMGQGISEPIKAEMVIGRKGLGLSASQGVTKNFRDKVSELLKKYLTSDDQDDLYFTPELSKEERAIIHNVGQKMGLKTGSKGKNEKRYLIVSRKRSAQELLEHVMNSGGATSKYEVIPPRVEHNDFMKGKEDLEFGHGKQ